MPALDVKNDSEAATQDDLRTLRRWVVVAGVWAVAATVVALVALLDDSGRAAERRANQTGERIARSEARVDSRLASLERRLTGVPTSAQVQQLRTEVGRAQRAASGAGSEVTALERRVDALESGSADSGGSSSDGLPRLRDLFP